MPNTNENTTVAIATEISVGDIYNKYLSEVDYMIRRADTVTMVLQDHYFGYSKDGIEKNVGEKMFYESSYEDIQTLLSVVRNNIFEARQIMSAVMEIELKNIVTRGKPSGKNYT